MSRVEPSSQHFLRQLSDFASKKLAYPVEDLDRKGEFAREAWLACAAVGLHGLPVPERFGGQGSDILTTVLAFEALGYHCRDNGLLFSMQAQLWATTMTLLRFAPDEVQERALPGLCDGSVIGAHAMTEPRGGSDAFGLGTTARACDGGYVLDGLKSFVTNAPIADFVIVYATEDRGLGAAGVSAFLVPVDTPGLTVGPRLEKMGLRTSPTADLSFTDCFVPRSARIGARGGGALMFTRAMAYERAFILAAALGTLRRQIDDCVLFARQREQFGRPIIDFQAVSHTLADMSLRLKCGRLLLLDAADAADHRRLSDSDSSHVKLHLSEALVRSSLDTLQLHGGHGYMTAAGLELDVRDALASRLYSGTDQIQRQIIADGLLSGTTYP
jgi:alkylation response protein AidB-like acyl-CoA dehydrogenase